MKSHGALSLSLALCAAASVQAGFIEWPPAVGGNGHFYEVVNVSSPIVWATARAFAEQSGGHLATITSAQENAFIAGLVQANNRDAFLGGYQANPSSPPNSGWSWVTDEAWDFTAWADGEPNDDGPPNESHLEMLASGDWNDCRITGSDHDQFAYVVEYTTPAPGALALLAIGGLTATRRRRDPR